MPKESEVEVLNPFTATEMEIHDHMALLTEAHTRALQWATDIVIKDARTLADAVDIGRDCRAAIKKIEDREKELTQPLNKKKAAIIATSKDLKAPFEAAREIANEKIEEYNIRKEAENKAKEEAARAERERIQREAEARERERRQEEERKQAEEIQRLAELKAKQDAAAKKVKDDQQRQLLKDQQEADRRAEAERIQQARLKREEEDRKTQAAEQEALKIRQAQLTNEIAKDVGAQAQKNVAKVWTYRILNEHEVPRAYCAPVASLLRAAVNSGVREIPGCEIYQDVQARLR